MEELKNCPFCGGKAQAYEVNKYPESIGKRYSVICTGCGAQVTTTYQEKHWAITAWNKRMSYKNEEE